MGETRVPAPPADPAVACQQHLLQAAIHLQYAKAIAQHLRPLELEKTYWQSADALAIVAQCLERGEPFAPGVVRGELEVTL